jgi:hypothetical protein
MPLGIIAAVLGIVLIAASSYSTYVGSRYQYQTNYTQLGFGICFSALGGIAELTAIILFLIWLYRAWRVVPPEYEGVSPGMAVGLLFVPIFNLYWMFRVIPGLSAALRRVLQDRDSARLHGAGFAEGVVACTAALIGGTRLLLPYGVPFLLWHYYDEGYLAYGSTLAAIFGLFLSHAVSFFLWLVWINRANSAKNRVIDSEIGGAEQIAVTERPREPGSPTHNLKPEVDPGQLASPNERMQLTRPA